MKVGVKNSLIRVIHVVLNGIQTSLRWARVTTAWASTSSRKLLRGVGNAVARAGAGVTLEGVQETKPVTDLVSDGLALVEVGRGAAWDSGVQDGAAITLEDVLVRISILVR
jgi:hypothetical protein